MESQENSIVRPAGIGCFQHLCGTGGGETHEDRCLPNINGVMMP